MTRKVNRRSPFFNFTKAPVTGSPFASLMTPCTEPRSSAAQTDWLATSTVPAAINAARFRGIVPWVIGCLLVAPALVLESIPWDRGNRELSAYCGEVDTGSPTRIRATRRSFAIAVEAMVDRERPRRQEVAQASAEGLRSARPNHRHG